MGKGAVVTRLGARCALLVLTLVLSSACTTLPAPTLTRVFPTSAYPRQLVGVDGSVGLASVVFDAGLASETLISNGLAGTRYFQVPTNALPGVHPVALRNATGQTAPVNLTVIGCDPRYNQIETNPGGGHYRPPEIDDVIPDRDLPVRPGDPPPPRPGRDAVGGFDLPRDPGVAAAPAGRRSGAGDASRPSVSAITTPDLQRTGAGPFGGLVACGAFPGPRVEDVAIFRVTDYGGEYAGRLANYLITVSAANLDTNARVSVAQVKPVPLANRELSSCVRWGGLPVDYLQHHIPVTFRYPIYHYGQMMCPLEHRLYGSVIAVTVTNIDGKSDTKTYTLPASLAEVDSDNDGLSDAAENRTSSVFAAPLGAMGGSPYRKSIFVEVDWMRGAQPNGGLWDAATAAFANAPVLNPDGSAGIDLIIDHGQGGKFTKGGELLTTSTFIDWDKPDDEGTSVDYDNPNIFVDFDTLKATNFSITRKGLFHYGVFAMNTPGAASGRGEPPGDDFFLSFAWDTFSWSRLDRQIYGFVHELGHNLGLAHGGLVVGSENAQLFEQMNDSKKPNQISVMNYRFGAVTFDQISGISRSCDYKPDMPLLFTYAEGMMADINEAAVTEGRGICDAKALDLTGDGAISPASVQADTNQDGDSHDVHREYDEWGNLRLKFRGTKNAED